MMSGCHVWTLLSEALTLDLSLENLTWPTVLKEPFCFFVFIVVVVVISSKHSY